ncbi:glycosyltransferase family 2 protein [Kaistella antarctica]|uniref:Glycosyl transferase family 2 n=1 Tax=Kaistella antarctica TaxID=266748 RepID=A0A448NTT7_9FLAO|nr:glycosyltransferase family 2 protein [Kaistella antarctica]KEY18265.1 glycosyl transferase family 2 [Kaistella antarctica]SEV84118.1 Glycosyl transferase family 2 [Kaistella antarctica]VEI00886.1 Hyaluronan synthase [Kaistella antarctica]
MVKVSIIVPVYQVEKYLRKCLDSLVNQSLQEIEILVINDGSPDQSQIIIDEFQKKHPLKIKSFTKENGGLSDARNFGLDRATGEFIGFVDSDDEVSENMFEEMYFLAKKHAADMVICNLQKVDQFGNVTQKLTQIPNMPEKIILRKNLSVFSDLSYFACNKIFKRELFKNKRFKKGVHFEDIQLIPQLLLDCKTIAQTQNYHYHYLERTDSISKTHTRKGLDILEAVEEVNFYFKDSQYSDKKEALQNFNILEGVYTFLAYLAFVKEDEVYREMDEALKSFIKKHQILRREIFSYKRFEKNYLLSLPLKKKIYYLAYFTGFNQLVRKFI